MTSGAAVFLTKEARVLAHKLFSQCRELTGPYHSIAGDVRRLRNVLEELEEALAEDTFDESQRTKALPAVANGRTVLARLDLAVQSFRCSKDSQIDDCTIATFKRNLEGATDELTATYDALTGSAEIAVRLMGRPSYDLAAAPHRVVNARDARRLSEDSSICSAVTAQDVHSQSSRTDLSIVSQTPNKSDQHALPTDEKELYVSTAIPKPSTLQPARRSPSSFSSLFANPDPMSMGLEAASSLIMAGEADAAVSPDVGANKNGRGISLETARASLMHEDPAVANARPAQAVSVDGDNDLWPKHQSNIDPERQPANAVVKQSERTDPPLRIASDARKDSGLELYDQQNPTIAVEDRMADAATRPLSLETSGTVKPSEGNCDMHAVAAKVARTPDQQQVLVPERNEVSAADRPKASDPDSSATSQTQSSNSSTDSKEKLKEEEDDMTLAQLIEQRKHNKINIAPEEDKCSLPVKPPPPITPPPRRSKQSSSFPPPPYNSLKPQGWQTRSHSAGKSEPQKPRSLSASNIEDSKRASNAAHSTSNVQSEDYSVEAVRVLDLAMRPVRRVSETFGEPVFIFPPSPNSKDQKSKHESPLRPRRPPPPPPSRSAPNPVIQQKPSRYRITNPTLPPAAPVAQPLQEEEADDDLYSSSRRGSPVIRAEVPQIRISSDGDSHTLDGPPKTDEPGATGRVQDIAADKSAAELSEPPTVPARPARSPASSPNLGSKPLATKRESSTPRGKSTAQARTRATSFEHDRSASLKECAKEVDVLLASRTDVTPKLLRNHSIAAPQVNRNDSTHAPERSNSKTAPELSKTRQQGVQVGVREFYVPVGGENSPEHRRFLDDERISAIRVSWHFRQWERVAEYLQEHLVSMIEQDCLEGMRRIRHLLGVVASFNGEWRTATKYFLSVFNKTIINISDIDEGTAAAAHWLGDIYALHNRRDEALLSYCIAGLNRQYSGRELDHFRECILFEQETIQLGPQARSLLWLAPDDGSDQGDSILHANIISREAAKTCLQNQAWSVVSNPYPRVEPGSRESRSRMLHLFGRSHNKMKLSREELTVGGPWPFPYDPMFVMGAVHEGRLLVHECDMLEVFQTNPNAKVTRSGPLGLGRRECFTHNDLIWLIKATRSCLRACGLEWSEIANVSGAWFCCRQRFFSDHVANFRYFSVAIFKKSFHAGYGLEVCPYGISTARNVPYEFTDLPHSNEKMVKNWKRLIREIIESAAAHGDSTFGGEHGGEADGAPNPALPPHPIRASATT